MIVGDATARSVTYNHHSNDSFGATHDHYSDDSRGIRIMIIGEATARSVTSIFILMTLESSE